MKKYRLKKWYPSLGDSIKEGDTVEASLLGSGYYRLGGFWKVDEQEVENNPEFWEKVGGKDYEILSFINTLNSRLYVPCNNELTMYNTEEDNFTFGLGRRSLNYCLKHYEIKSVRRLSDGEIFNIGDKVQDSLTDGMTGNKVQKINYFYHGNKLICQAESGTTMPLSTIRKAQEPLFVSYDGVEVIEGDMYYCVHRNDNYSFSGEIVELNNVPYPFDSSAPVFAKKENAEKYIRDNEKKYSLNDIKETVKKLGCFGTTLIEYLENENR